MKLKYVSVAILCAILLLNIIFTQYMVHQYYYENYINTINLWGIKCYLIPYRNIRI